MRLVHPVANACDEGSSRNHLARRQTLGRGVQRRQQDERPGKTRGQHCQRCHPPRQNIGVGRHAIVRQAVPGGQFQHHRLWGGHSQRGPHRLHPLVVARDMHHRLAPRQFARQQGRVKALGGAAKENTIRHRQPSAPSWMFWYMPNIAVTKMATIPSTCVESL